MIKLCKAFILPLFEYASPLFIGLSKARVERRRIEHGLILVCKSIYGPAPNYIQETFILRSNGYSLRYHLKVVISRPTSSYMQHFFMYKASKQWNNLPDKIRLSESLSTFRKNLQGIPLSSSYDCNYMFCK